MCPLVSFSRGGGRAGSPDRQASVLLWHGPRAARGEAHLGSEASTSLLHAVEFPPRSELQDTLRAVDRIFELFHIMFEEQLEYALRADGASVESLADARQWRSDTARAA